MQTEHIRLAELIPEFLGMVDEEIITVNAAIQLMHLSRDQQYALLEIIKSEKCIPSLTQARRIKVRAMNGLLDHTSMHKIMTEDNPTDYTVVIEGKKLHDILAKRPEAEREKYVAMAVSFYEETKKFFPENMPLAQMKDEHIRILEAFNQRQHEKDNNE